MIFDTFTKTYSDRTYKHVTVVRHRGTVIALAMDENRKIAYSVLDLQNKDIKSPLDVNFWFSNPKELRFPNEIAEVGIGIADQTSLPEVKTGSRLPEPAGTKVRTDEKDLFLSSTARFTQDAAFQALSDGHYIYIFRQAIPANHVDNVTKSDAYGNLVLDASGNPVKLVDDTLLVDRFVLSGAELKTKMEIRYQRSRSRTRPQSRKDSLGAKDMNDNPFYEPTQELRFVSNLTEGRFTVLLLPTKLPNVQRWQIFAHNNKTGMIDSINVQRSDDGLFNTHGSQESITQGYAESAIDFDDGNAFIALNKGVNVGAKFTQEAWIYPRSSAPASKDQALIDGSGRTKDSAPSMWITQRRAIRAGFGDGKKWYEFVSGKLLQLDEWNHIAVVFDGSTYRLYINGEESYRTNEGNIDGNSKTKAALDRLLPLAKDGIHFFGASKPEESFRGILDEVRLWDRPRSQSELKRDMHTRLTGFEPGLAGYWRFDEASGDTIYDQTNQAVNGTLTGGKWVTSNAPLGENAGLQRNSFIVSGRSVVSGLTALLYYHQESETDSKGGQIKPLKRNGRVMLAFATHAPSITNKEIATLDFGVSSLGRLAQAPDNLQLDMIQPPSSDGLSVSDRLGRISNLEQVYTTLNQDIFNLTADIAILGQTDAIINDAISNPLKITRTPDKADPDLKSRLDTKFDHLRDAWLDYQQKATAERNLKNDLAAGRVYFYEHAGYAGRAISAGLGYVGYTFLNQNGFNDIISSISFSEALAVTVYEHANRGGKSKTFDKSTDWVGGDFNDIISSADVYVHPAFQQKLISAEVARQKAEAEISQSTRDLQTEQINLRALRSDKERERNAKQLQATSTFTELQSHRGKLSDGVSVTMPLVHTDPLGLSITGGVLGFAWTNEAPQLFDSATGKLALYFRGSDDQFFVCYYNTSTQRAQYNLSDEHGIRSAVCLARSTEPEMDQMKIEVTEGPKDDSCTVIITGAGMEETWEQVPRLPERFARVLNGDANERAYIGSGVLESEQGRVEHLNVEDGIRRTLEAGATLRAGEIKLIVREAAPRGATLIAVDSATTIPPNEELPFFYFEYDYAGLAKTSKVPGDLSNGSLLVWVASLGNGWILDQETQSGSTLACQWTAALPGHTLSFDGKDDFAQLSDTSPASLKKFAAPGDVTLEAWVRPREMADEARLLQHRSTASSYTLGLKRQELRSALKLDGVSDMIAIPNKDHLNFSGVITIEAWIKPDVPANFQGWMNIVAHGFADSPMGEVFLRITGDANGTRYEIGSWDGTNHIAAMDVPASEKTGNSWVHLAGVYDGTAWQLYHNGELKATLPDNTGAVSVKADWAIGSRGGVSGRWFKGQIDEVRIWKRVRSEAEIDADMWCQLSGIETDLVGYWHFEDRAPVDRSRYHNHGLLHGNPGSVVSPLPAYQIFAGAGEKFVQSRGVFPGGSWNHLAATFNQSYAIELGGNASYLDCGNDTTLDIGGDLTIEVFVQLSVAGIHGLVTKGEIDDGTVQDTPYSLYVDDRGAIVFAFEDSEHGNQTIDFGSSGTVAPGGFYRVAVTRKRGTLANANGTVDQWHDILLYINGVQRGSKKYEGKDPGSSNGSFVIGRTFLENHRAADCIGKISEVRIWNNALAQQGVGIDIKGSEKGLVSWWRFEENEGNVAYDSKSTNHAKFKGNVSWVKNPDASASGLLLYRDGETIPTDDKPGTAFHVATTDQFALGALINANATQQDFFQGEMEELRIWNVARTQEQVQDNIFRRLVGEKEDLIAYYTFDAENENKLSDHSFRGNDLLVRDALYVISTAPIGEDIPQVRSALAEIHTPFSGLLQSHPAVQEYGDMQYDVDGNLIGTLKRCYAYILYGQWQLVTGFKVGNLVTEWIGQVQFAPELKGFIEGAPPVPGENLTALEAVGDYNGGSSVEMVDAEKTTYTYSATRSGGVDSSLDMKLGALLGADVSAGLGLITKAIDVENLIGFHFTFEQQSDWLDGVSTGIGLTTTKISKIELRGFAENANDVAYPYPKLGQRFIPDNLGYALVQSETADVYALRLAHNNALVAYQMLPNPDIPKDWNIISFPLNRFYSKQGTLDGKIGLDADLDYPNALSYSPDSSYFKPIKAYALKSRIQREEEAARLDFKQYSMRVMRFGTGALKPELEKDLGYKRNLVNTYVWTSDGGQFAETQETIEVQQENSGSSYGFKMMAGVYTDLKFKVSGNGMKLELDAMLGGHFNITVSKSQESETSFGVSVDLSNVERDIYLRSPDGELVMDNRDSRQLTPKLWPGKVNAYRFMTFYFEPRTEHYDAFFGKVVDPIWLEQGDDPNAEALRQARGSGTKSECWRIFHRVTFVSRILPDLTDSAAPPLERTLKELDIDSNYELIKLLEPFVTDELTNFAEFAQAIRLALKTYHPELQPHSEAIIQFMSLYYGITEEAQPQLGAGENEDGLMTDGSAPLPTVDAGPEYLITTESSELELQCTLTNSSQPLENLLILWSKVKGPGSVAFDQPNALITTATFGRRGLYRLRLSVNDGLMVISDDIEIVVNSQPQVSAGEDRQVLKSETVELVGALLDGGLGDPQRGAVRLKWERVDGPGTVNFKDKEALRTQVTFSKSGSYLLRLTANNGTFEVSDEVVIVVAGRVTNGLQALYVFKESQGNLVRDVASFDPNLPLTILDESKVQWVADKGLAIIGPVALQTMDSATRLIKAMQASNALTVEAWIKPEASLRPGLARILTISEGPGSRNFTLGQDGDRFYATVRTVSTNLNASDKALSGGKAVLDKLLHLVCTREPTGSLRLFVDSVQVAQRPVDGSFANWNKDYRMALGNEFSVESQPDRAWSGEYHLIALYSRALTPQEVKQNYEYGADTNLQPLVSVGADLEVNLPNPARLKGVLADERLPLDQLQVSWTQAGGPTMVDFESPRSIQTQANFRSSGKYVLRLTVSDGELSSSDELTVIVNQSPTINAGAEQIIVLPDKGQLHGAITSSGLSDDPSTSKLRIEWSQVLGLGTAVIQNPHELNSEVGFNKYGIYGLQLSVDNGLLAPALAVVTFYVNQKPVIRASADPIFALPGKVTLVGEIVDLGLADPNGTIIHTWAKVSGPGEVNFGDTHALTTTAQFSQGGVYILNIAVETSGHGYHLQSEAEVTVIANQPPDVDAGPDQLVILPALAELDGTASDDGLPDPPGRVSHWWTKVSGPGDVIFSNPESDLTTAAFTMKGVYVLELAVSDGQATGTDQLEITANQAPSIHTEAQIKTNPNQPATLQMEITDNGLGNPALGKLLVNWKPAKKGMQIADPSAQETTATASKRGRYPVDLEVKNGFAEMTTQVQVLVFDPPVVEAGEARVVRTNEDVKLAGQILDSGLDQHETGPVNLRWEMESGPAAPNISDPSNLTGTVRFPVKGGYLLRLIADNGFFSGKDTVQYSVNAKPKIQGPGSQTILWNTLLPVKGRVIDDGRADPTSGELTYHWLIADGPDGVQIESPDALETRVSFTQKGVYTLRLEVSNGFVSSLNDSKITVNEPLLVDAGVNQTVRPETKVTLHGIVLVNGLGDPSQGSLNFQWTLLSGPTEVNFSTQQSPETQVTLSRIGTYLFQFAASSGELTATDQVQVDVVKK